MSKKSSLEIPTEFPKKRVSGALAVALGIFISRFFGLLRERVFAHYFGQGPVADALRAALRIPNILQNLLGEGVLSGSFIPAYSSLLSQGKKEEARFLTYSVGSFLFFLVSLLVFLGVFGAPWLVELLAPGFQGEQKKIGIAFGANSFSWGWNFGFFCSLLGRS